jgi:glycine cleavage system H lipoate-binding protein
VPGDPSGIIFHSNVATIVILAILFTALLVAAVFYFAKRGDVQPSPEEIAPGQLNPESIGIPQGLLFSKSHTWSFMDRDGKVKIGIDDFMQHIVGPVTRIEMKKAGEKIRKGDILVTLVQNGKQLHLYSPVSGTIAEFNPLLKSDPSQLNASPYSSGWIYRVEPANWMKELQFMEMADSYRKWIADEFSRLRDFLATSIKVSRPELQYVVLQDGGHLKDHVLADFGPEVWEDFQTSFLDKAK